MRRPPIHLRALVAKLLPPGDRAHLLGELDRLYERRLGRDGRVRATLWYLGSALGFPLRLAAAAVARGLAALPPRGRSVGRDLRHGVRVLRRRPGYTVASVVTLGVGVGGVATVYGAANWVLLRPVPGVEEPVGLVTVRMEQGEGSPAFPISHPDLRDLRERIPALESLEASSSVEVHLQPPGATGATRHRAAVVTSGYFDVLTLRPEVGRLPAGEPGTVVVSDRLWREFWARGNEAVGSSLRINGHPFTVVGVAAAGFRGAELPGETDLWLPVSAWSVAQPGVTDEALSDRGRAVWRDLVGRLAVTDAGLVRTQGAVAMDGIREDVGWPHSFAAAFTLNAYPGLGLSPRIRHGVERTLVFLGGIATLLLLLALANVTNLALVHGAGRMDSMAVHAALGASRARIAGRLMAEHVVLGLAGATVGIAVAVGITRLFRKASLSSLGASLEGIRLEPAVVVFTGLVALAAALLAGSGPALDAARRATGHLGGTGRHGRPRTFRIQSGLVVAQVGLSTLLIVGAGLLTRSVLNLRSLDPGFDPADAVRFSIDPRVQGYGDEAVRDLLERGRRALVEIPGVTSAGFVAPTPIHGSRLTFAAMPRGGSPDEDVAILGQFEAAPGFLTAMRPKLLAGRLFEEEDVTALRAGAERPIVLARAAVDSLYPGISLESAVGRVLASPRRDATFRIRGVIDDIRLAGGDVGDFPVVFLPWSTGYGFEVDGWVRLAPGANIRGVLGRIREALLSVDAALPVYDLRTVRSQMDILITEQRVVSRLALALAVIGLFLVGVGLQGVLGYMVAQRRREIGVRAALGASSATIVGALVRRGVTLTTVGVVIGIAAGAGLNRVIESRLFGVTPLDPVTYLAGAAALLLTTVAAVWAPAVRSTRIPAREALTAE